jgi:hypothetical protein
MAGYSVGPTLAPGEPPWPGMWEQDPRIDDGHAHVWECCLLAADGLHRLWIEEIVRCAVCLAPRCGHSIDDDPCMERRHHRACHRYLSGRREHLGGLAQTCGCR